MFEKSLYHLIKGLRLHKGNERDYIQNCLKECRAEIRSQDLDLKATALLKLIYLEMLGYDMSWASFHVLEVMSSAKYHQKKVGYLGVVQSFRPDTEVLMLATNLLKKDLSCPLAPTMQLPIAALPHVITPSLALSVVSDLLPRLSHTNPNIRKKTLVTLYRLALVYPETLKAAWPKIKERLMDKSEDASVTASIVNVICELSWRRPSDFLPLAPRLFELLVDAENNWMAIKLIKLFATLTPLEPRLARKILPPLTKLIQSTHAMSLLYECVNGITQGGILGGTDDIQGKEEIATLCVSKLRGMLLTDGDPNLTYVALLAFNKIVLTHPVLVSRQEDVILSCLDNPDITIRIKALDLAQGMVSRDNLVPIVSRLLKQLKTSHSSNSEQKPPEALSMNDMEVGEAPGWKTLLRTAAESNPPLPQEYRTDIIGRVLEMCSHNNYGCLIDFHWYIDILVQLVRIAPPSSGISHGSIHSRTTERDISERIGYEVRNVAVKVRAMREIAVSAAAAIIVQVNIETPFGHPITNLALKATTWLVGEYASQLIQPRDTLSALLALMLRTSCPEILAHSLQAIPKLFARIATEHARQWGPDKKSQILLLLTRVIHAIEPMMLHPNLEVQERAVEFLELFKLVAEAVAGQEASSSAQEPPLLLEQAIPSLFSGSEINAVAAGAQRRVPVPDYLDLDEPIHPDLDKLLADTNTLILEPEESDEFDAYYYRKPPPTSMSSVPAISRLADVSDDVPNSYQQVEEDSYLDADIVARRKAERLERNKEDPFYIQPQQGTSARPGSTPLHNIIQSYNEPDMDLETIPIMKLDISNLEKDLLPARPLRPRVLTSSSRTTVVVAADETLGGEDGSNLGGKVSPPSGNNSDSLLAKVRGKKKSLLQVDSSNIRTIKLEGSDSLPSPFAFEQRQREDAEMARAMKDVERLRLKMQRLNERIDIAPGVDAEGVAVVKKVTKQSKAAGPAVDGAGVAVKKKKKKPIRGEPGDPAVHIEEPIDSQQATTIADAEGASGAGKAQVDVDLVPYSVAKKKKRRRTVEIEEIP